ncbi:MAG: (2Fe-2S)-binding protein [Planctomycetales bacterium]|nr:(2Fe-2S)-binding protein [Planctomycetales bacterium]
MRPEDDLCLCFHVSRRKVENFLRIERPRAASQLAACYGAGTGCGWCRPLLERLFEASRDATQGDAELPSAEEHVEGRTAYVARGGGNPPPEASL